MPNDHAGGGARLHVPVTGGGEPVGEKQRAVRPGTSSKIDTSRLTKTIISNCNKEPASFVIDIEF